MSIIHMLCGDVGLTKQVSNGTVLHAECWACLYPASPPGPTHHCPHPPLGDVCYLPMPSNFQELGSMMYLNSTHFNQQDSTDTSPTEIDELALAFPCICIILNFSGVEFFYCHLKGENLVNWMQCWLAQYYNCTSWTPTACMSQLFKFPLYY